MKRKFLAAVIGAAMVVTMGCATTAKAPQATAAESRAETTGEAAAESEKTEAGEGDKKAAVSDITVGVIFGTGGLGDKNFNDMAYAGVVKAQEELGIEFDYVEPNAISDFVPLGRQFAETEEYDLIIAVGADQEEAMREISEEFPDQKIALIDSSADIQGVSSLQTEWSEQTFLAGVIAGLGTKSGMDKANADNVIGVILGADLPNLREGVAGYTAGAKYVNPDVEVLVGVVGAFNDPGKGKEIALSMYNKGADYIQCIAGASGLGVFGAAKEADKYAFGVGSNQNGEDADHIVASSIRSIETMVFNEIEKVSNGTWESGVHLSGMKEGVVGCDTSGSNAKLTADIETAVADIKGKLVSGELVPCKNEADLGAWTAENQYTK